MIVGYARVSTDGQDLDAQQIEAFSLGVVYGRWRGLARPEPDAILKRDHVRPQSRTGGIIRGNLHEVIRFLPLNLP